MKLKKLLIPILAGASILAIAQSATAASIPKPYYETTDIIEAHPIPIASGQFNFGYLNPQEDVDYYVYKNNTDDFQHVQVYLASPLGLNYDFLVTDYNSRPFLVQSRDRTDVFDQWLPPGYVCYFLVAAHNHGSSDPLRNYVFWLNVVND
ncbi:hypothetical protein ACFPYJ_08410 [Paenibacillus solisilvae]|uniref:Uncharacterized protein n=1 Tax=Paenibacillus solisilvae TaxID=2486751 RepID=A0ABW0VXB6_9BACL